MSKLYIGGGAIEHIDTDVNSLNGENWNNYNILKKYTVDLSSYSTDLFYPILFWPTNIECEFIINHARNFDINNPYNANYIHFLLTQQGWQDAPKVFTLLARGVYDINEITIGSVVTGSMDGFTAIYLRGGKVYYLSTNASMRYTNDFSIPVVSANNEVYKPGKAYTGETVNTTVVWSA